MSDADALENLKALVGALEIQAEANREVLELLAIHRRRVDAIETTLDEALAALMNVPATVRLILAMKGATLTMTCSACGTVYAKEPGPELCGPCWVKAGRPGTIGLHLVTPAPAPERKPTV